MERPARGLSTPGGVANPDAMDNEALPADGAVPAAAVFAVAEGAGATLAVEAGPLPFEGPPATSVPMAQRPIFGAKTNGFLGSSVVPVITRPLT